MSGFVDLHCHCVPGIDDGVRSVPEALSLLGALGRAGFTEVVATPHMRAGMFDNAPADLTAAFDRLAPALGPELPKVSLSSEHYFDDVVFKRLLAGEAMPYPGGRAVLLEFYEMDFGPSVANRLFDLRRRQLIPVIAHPERYRYVGGTEPLDQMRRWRELGALLQVNAGSFNGYYAHSNPGAEGLAWAMVERGLVDLISTDHHGMRRAGVSLLEAFEALTARGERELAERVLARAPDQVARATLNGDVGSISSPPGAGSSRSP